MSYDVSLGQHFSAGAPPISQGPRGASVTAPGDRAKALHYIFLTEE